MKHKITSLQIAQLFLVVFLLLIGFRIFRYPPDGIYTLLRIIATTVSIWSAIKTPNDKLRLVFVFIAILFNPIILIKMSSSDWRIIDIAVAVFYILLNLLPWFIKDPWKARLTQTKNIPQSDVKNDIVYETLQTTQESEKIQFQQKKSTPPSMNIRQTPKEHVTFWQRFTKLFQGRLSRAAFVIRFILTFIGAMLIGFIYNSIFSTYVTPDMFFVAALCLLVLLALIVYWFSIVIRRLHDTNASGFYSIPLMVGQSLGIIGFVGIIILACFPGTKGANKYGEQPE